LCVYRQFTIISQVIIQENITGLFVHIHYSSSTDSALLFITQTLSFLSQEGLC